MMFDWDDDKNESNIKKHGIDFEDVSVMFDYPMILEVDNRENYGEERWVGIGILKTLIAVVIYVERDEDVIRIISARKAKKHEQEKYTNRLGTFGEYDG